MNSRRRPRLQASHVLDGNLISGGPDWTKAGAGLGLVRGLFRGAPCCRSSGAGREGAEEGAGDGWTAGQSSGERPAYVLTEKKINK